MKKLLLACCMVSASTSFAMSTVNLDTTNYHCNGVKLTSQTTITTLTTNCRNAKVIIHSEPNGGMYANRQPGGGAEMTMITPPDPNDESLMDKVEFYSDKGTYMICYYNNNKYVKCKAKPSKNPKVASSTPTITKSTASKPASSIAN